MKQPLLAALAFGLLFPVQAHATVSIIVGAGDLLSGGSGSPLAPSSTLALLVVDTTGGGFYTGPLYSWQSLTNGATLGKANNIIYTNVDLSFGGPGYLETAISGGKVSGSFAVGMAMAIYWFPGRVLGASYLGGSLEHPNVEYGEFWGGRSPDLGDPWIIPAEGSAVSFVMQTQSEGGPTPDSAGYSIPEPSAFILSILGLAGLSIWRLAHCHTA